MFPGGRFCSLKSLSWLERELLLYSPSKVGVYLESGCSSSVLVSLNGQESKEKL